MKQAGNTPPINIKSKSRRERSYLCAINRSKWDARDEKELWLDRENIFSLTTRFNFSLKLQIRTNGLELNEPAGLATSTSPSLAKCRPTSPHSL